MGDVMEVIGGVMIALAVLVVHDAVSNEHKIDAKVKKTIKKEHIYVFLGITFILGGFVLNQIGTYII